MKNHCFKMIALLALSACIASGCSSKTEAPKASSEAKTEASKEETKPEDQWEAKEHSWKFAYFGTSTSEKTNQMDSEGGLDTKISLKSCTVKEDGSIDKKGGKFAAGEGYDGISFYYTEIDAKNENFLLKADVTIDYVNPTPDGQEGVALLVRDSLGENGVSDCSFYTNSAAVIASKLDYVAEDGTKTSVKDGVGYRMITGVDSPVTPPDGNVLKLDSQAFLPEVKLTAGDTYTFQLEKTNTGYHGSYYNASGEKMEHILYGVDELLKIDPDHVYAGFAVARGCNATFSNITFTTSNPAEDAQALEKPDEEIPVKLEILSAGTTGSSEYTLSIKANADGILKVLTDTADKTSRDEGLEVKAGQLMEETHKLDSGEHTFTIEFTPKDGYMPEEGVKLDSYETVKTEYKVICRPFETDILYAAADGAEEGDGTKEKPLDLPTALKFVTAGQTILLREGVYELKDGIVVARGINGTEENPIVMKPENGSVIVDFKGEGQGFEMGGNYWSIEGISFCHSADGAPGIRVSGSNNILKGLKTYENGNTGLQISGSSQEKMSMWPSNNQILNCTSYNNSDAAMEDADGFAAKLTCGPGNVFDGCVAAYNADDGWDLFAKIATGPIGAVTIKNCVAFKNGYLYKADGTIIEAGNGNGFKMGGTGISGHHVLRNSISYENKAKGIDSNSCPDIEIYDNVSFNNQGANIALYTSNKADTAFAAQGNISFRLGMEPVKEEIVLKGQDEALIYTEHNYFYDEEKDAYVNSLGEEVTEGFFESLDTGVMPSRDEEGNLDLHGLLKLKK